MAKTATIDWRRVVRAVALLSSISVGLSCCVYSEDFKPSWARIEPTHRIYLKYETSASSEVNGERLRQACQSLQPGDRLVIQAGEYSVNRLWKLDCCGSETRPIWIEAEQAGKVIVTRPDSKQNIVNIGADKTVEFLRIAGIEFRGGSQGVRLQSCRDVWIDNCEIHHTADVALSANSHDSQRLYLIGNTIHDTTGTGEGMYLGGNNGNVIMSQSIIALNHVYNCGGDQGDGIEIKQGSWGNRIVENKIHDCHYPCITVYGTNGKARNVIEQNLCYNSQDNVMQVQGEALIQNNILINGQNSAFASTDHQGKTINLTVVHNTMLNRYHAFRGASWNDRSGMILANNVIYSAEGSALHFTNGSAGVTIEGNVLLGGKVPAGNSQGTGLNDFVQSTWDASSRDLKPRQRDGLFAQASKKQFSTQFDFAGKARLSPLLSGAWND